MMFAQKRYLLAVSLLVSIIWSAFFCLPVRADDVMDSISEAIQYYKDGDYAEATSSLDYAAQLIRQKRGANLKGYLPEPLPGWTAEEGASQAVSASVFGGMISAERKYHKNDSTVTIKVVTDAPMLQGMLMMFANPMMATADGGCLKKINKQKAIIKYQPNSKSGEINVIVAKHVLVTIEGQNVSEKDLLAYAKAVDYERMKEL